MKVWLGEEYTLLSMNKSSDPNDGYVSSELLPGKKFESLAGQHPGAERSGAKPLAGQCTIVIVVVFVVVVSRLVSVYLYAGTTYVPAERRAGSIAGALSHTLSFSSSIGPERGHEKRLINRTNTGTFLPWDI